MPYNPIYWAKYYQEHQVEIRARVYAWRKKNIDEIRKRDRARRALKKRQS